MVKIIYKEKNINIEIKKKNRNEEKKWREK